jgi:hypothetical protein
MPRAGPDRARLHGLLEVLLGLAPLALPQRVPPPRHGVAGRGGEISAATRTAQREAQWAVRVVAARTWGRTPCAASAGCPSGADAGSPRPCSFHATFFVLCYILPHCRAALRRCAEQRPESLCLLSNPPGPRTARARTRCIRPAVGLPFTSRVAVEKPGRMCCVNLL